MQGVQEDRAEWQSEAGKLLTRVQHGYTDLRLLDTSSVADAIDRMYGKEKLRRSQQHSR